MRQEEAYYTVVRFHHEAQLFYNAYKGKKRNARIPKNVLGAITNLLEVLARNRPQALMKGTEQIQADRKRRGLYDAEVPQAADLKIHGWQDVPAGKPVQKNLYPERTTTIHHGRKLLKNRKIIRNKKQIFGYLSGKKHEKKLNSPQGIRRQYPKYPSPRWFYTGEGSAGTSSRSVPE